MGSRSLTIKRLAETTGMARTTVHRHLRGGHPQRDALAKYAPVLGVPVEELAALAGYRVPEPESDVVRAIAIEVAMLSEEQQMALLCLVRAMR